ncbi:MAG: S-adenosyl-l-methionine hydroxide adenosyltransferase family protein [Myxococcota bacterium]
MTASCLTLLTDFGVADGYVAAMKGVILSRCADVQLIDITHEIPPGDIRAAAYVLLQAVGTYPSGTVHLVVVDPGVGSERRALACRGGDQLFVGPDNGVLAAALEDCTARQAVVLTRPELWRESPSAVFHGRDVFAPVAARLAAGGRLEELGDAVDPATLIPRPWSDPERCGEEWIGEVIHVDRFGNLITNLPLDEEHAWAGELRVGALVLPLRRCYSDAPEGDLLGLRGSSGLLEIACNRGRAVERLGEGRGLVVSFRASRGS